MSITILDFISIISGTGLLEVICKYPDQSVLLYKILNITGNLMHSSVALEENDDSNNPSYTISNLSDLDKQRILDYLEQSNSLCIYGDLYTVTSNSNTNNDLVITMTN